MKKTFNIKHHYSWIIIISIFVLMLVIFLVFGEINLSKLNWLVAVNGKKWGEVIEDDGNTIMSFGINTNSCIVSPYIFIIMVGILLLFIGVSILLILFKQMQFASLPYIVASWFVFFSIIVTGLLYPNKNESFQWQILVRVVVILITYPLIFFPVNFIVKKCFINTKFGEFYIDDLIAKEKESAKHINEINKVQIKKQKDKDFVELSDKEI